jgi:transcriptional regulator with XRE-family HTH domain
MRKADVIAYFGGTQAATARALGLTKSAVNQWPDDRPIPLKSALKANARSKGELPLNMSVYDLPDMPRQARPHRRHVSV